MSTKTDRKTEPNPPITASASAETPGEGEGQGEIQSGARSVDDIKYDLVAAIKTVYDPEIPVDVYELGLIYELDVDAAGEVRVIMTLTTPMCPAAEIIPPEVEAKAREVEGVTDVLVELVWDPPWDMEMMSPAARLQLNV